MLNLIKKTVTDRVSDAIAHASARRDVTARGVKLSSTGALHLEKTSGAVNALALVMRGTEDPRLVGASSDGALRAWSTNTGALTSRVRAHEGEARALETSGTAGTGKVLLLSAGGKDGVVVARDAITGTIETEHTGLEGLDAELGEVRCVASLRDGRVVAGDDEGRVFVWEHNDTLPCWRWSTKKNVGVENLSPRGRGKTPRTSPDAVNAVCGWTHRQSGEEFVATGNGRGSLQLWRVHQSKALATFDEVEGGHRGAIHAVCDNDGVIITAGADGRVLAWYVNENGELLGPPEVMDVGAHHTGSVLSVINISPGVVCTGGTDQRALIWDVKSRAMMFECPSTKAGAVMSLAFDDSADVLYTGCALNQISRWELPMGERMSPREHANDPPLLTRKLSYDSFESWDQNDAPAAHQSSVSHGSVAVETKLDTSSELTSAQSMLVRVTEELDEMKMSDRILTQKVASLENELRAERASLASAREEIQQLRTPAASKGETFDATLKAKCEKMELIARKQKSKIDELKANLKLAVDERRDKCDELGKLSKTVEELRKELELARSSAPAKDTMSLDVEEMMAAAERALLSPQQVSEEAPSEIMRELHSIREEFNAAEQTISKLNSRLSSVEEEKESISAQHARLVDETSGHADKLRAVQAELDGVRRESDAALTTLREQLDQAKNRANALDKELSDAKVTLSARDENAKSVDVLTVLQTENAAKDKRIKELDAKHSLARQKLENAVTKGKGFQQECMELKIQLQNAQDGADGQRKELVELKSQLNAARTLEAEFESRHALANAEAERVRAQLSEVQGKASKSDETMAQLREDLKRADQRVREAEESVASSAERHQAELSELKRKFDSAVQKGKGFQQECAELKKQLQEREAMHQEKCDAIMSRAGLNEANVQRLVDTMSAQREELEHLKQDFENTEEMSRRLQEENAKLKTTMEERTGAIDAARAELEEARSEAQRAMNALKSLESQHKSEITTSAQEVERLREALSTSEVERGHLVSQMRSTEEAQSELMKLRDCIQTYEVEMSALKSTVETAKAKFSNAVAKGKGYQAEAAKLREELDHAKDTNDQVEDLSSSLEIASQKVSESARIIAEKDEMIARLIAQLKQSQASQGEDERGKNWLEQQARATAEAQASALADENERLRQEVAAASAAAQEAWVVASSHGVRPGESRPTSEIGSPVREGLPARARSLYQHPTYRGAMSMIYERQDSMVPREDYDQVKEHCAKLKRDLETAKAAAKEAVQQVINRLEMEVMAKVHAETLAKAAEAECKRAWAHAKDALATAREIQKKQLPIPVESLRPQPPPGTRAAAAMERDTSGALIIRQEHLLSVLIALLAFVIGAVFTGRKIG